MDIKKKKNFFTNRKIKETLLHIRSVQNLLCKLINQVKREVIFQNSLESDNL